VAYSIFISSTRQDLIPYRDAVSLHLRKAGYEIREMEIMGARDQEPLEACLQEVVDAELFVGIYAYRYGFIPRDSAVSITEQELIEAQRRRKPIFCFLVDENQEWPAAFREDGDGARRLEALKRRVRDQWVVETFTSPEGLAASVLGSLRRWQERQHPAELPPERHVQLALLDKVERFWIDGVLRQAVPEGRRLRINREERPDAVGRPVPEGAVPELAVDEVVEPIQDLFRRGQSLLLLGQPGSGKTIALLELARGLARVARRDPTAAVPVLFNLASWKGQDRSLAGWMARELARRYQAGLKAATEWIERNQILPLLDGLDEVEPECRPGCVDAINAHLRDHGLVPGMAVACHTQVYQELPARLQLETAVALRPLTPAQVDEHLGAAGPAFAGVRAALAGDTGLRELAASPLMLTLLERTFQNAAPEDLPSGRAAGIERFFEAYVTHVLEPGRELPWAREETGRPRGLRNLLPWNRYRGGASAPPPPEGRYPPEPARRSLAWLAHGMAEHDPALFQVERLQPAWLASRLQVFAYAVLSRALGGCLLAVPLSLGFGRPELGGAALLAGALVGAVETVRLCRRTSPAGRNAATLGRSLVRTLLLGGTILLSVFLIGLPWAMAPNGQQAWRLAMLFRVSLLFGLLLGVVFGVRGTGRDANRDTRVAEALVWRAWSWRGTAIGASSLLVFSLASWGLLRLGSDVSISYLDAGFWVPFSLIVTLLGGILFGAFGGLGGRALEKKAWPNQGTWLALRNAGVAGLITGLAAVLALGLALGSLDVAGRILEGRSPLTRGTLLWLPLQVGLVLGVWAGLAYSGLDFLQHFSLRLVLRLARLVPGRLIGFLDHAVERGLLQRPGGSYKFFHPLLLEHFAKSYGSPTRTHRPVTPA
jgi:eukaryotic-like serine/threonine-protein kinase